MPTEAFPLAAAGAIYPVAFAVIVTLLSGRDPLIRSIVFLVGGAIASLVGFIVIVTLLESLHLTPRAHPHLSGAIKVGLGGVLLVLAARTLWRRHRPPAVRAGSSDEPKSVADVEEAERHSLWRTFASGVLVYIPGVFLIASAKSIADSHSSVLVIAVSSVICVILLLLIVEIPIVAYAISPDRVRPGLQKITGWARDHSKILVLAIELFGGLYLVATGIETLVTA